LIRAFVPDSSFLLAENQLRIESHALLTQLGLIDKLSILAGELSYGQQKVLEIVRIILADPVLFLFDEPAAGLDPSTKQIIVNLILDLKTRNKTVVLIEHDLRFVRRLCDQVVVMNQGMPIYIGTPGGLADDPYVRESYLNKGAYL